MDSKVYLLLFLEGILAFVSPCFLPMIPVYLTFLAGKQENDKRQLMINSLGFIMGFTLIFVLLGMSATTISQFLIDERILIQRIGGLLVIFMGLNMMGILKIGLFNRDARLNMKFSTDRFSSSLLFGIIIAFGWSPCLGSFLTAALLTAGTSGTVLKGGLMLLTFSLGLGVPFFISALLFNSLTEVFRWIKQHYNVISKISGLFLILIGLLMVFDKFIIYSNMFY